MYTKPCGGELARDSLLTVGNNVECYVHIASKLAPTWIFVTQTKTPPEGGVLAGDRSGRDQLP